eukprot:6559056-Lingulodinium_polyedra.AAC.1
MNREDVEDAVERLRARRQPSSVRVAHRLEVLCHGNVPFLEGREGHVLPLHVQQELAHRPS